MRSKLPSAERFQDWVVEEVLPPIRKHGVYATDQIIDNILADPDFGIKLLTDLKEERAKNKELARKNEALELDVVEDKKVIEEQMEVISQQDDDLGFGKNYRRARAIDYLSKYFDTTSKGFYITVGHYLSKLSLSMSVPAKVVPDPNYPAGVRAYHYLVVDEFRKRLDTDTTILDKYRKYPTSSKVFGIS